MAIVQGVVPNRKCCDDYLEAVFIMQALIGPEFRKDIGAILGSYIHKKGQRESWPLSLFGFLIVLLAAAHKVQQEHEHVDKVEVEVQRAHDGRFSQPFAIAAVGVLQIGVLDFLGVIGCEACKY